MTFPVYSLPPLLFGAILEKGGVTVVISSDIPQNCVHDVSICFFSLLGFFSVIHNFLDYIFFKILVHITVRSIFTVNFVKKKFKNYNICSQKKKLKKFSDREPPDRDIDLTN